MKQEQLQHQRQRLIIIPVQMKQQRLKQLKLTSIMKRKQMNQEKVSASKAKVEPMDTDIENPPRSNEEDPNLGPSGDSEQSVDNDDKKRVNESARLILV